MTRLNMIADSELQCAFLQSQLIPGTLKQAGDIHMVSVRGAVRTILLLCLPGALNGKNLLNETDEGTRGEWL